MLVTDDGGNVAIFVNLSDICAVRYENFAVNSNGNTYKKRKSRLNCIFCAFSYLESSVKYL